MLGSRMGMPATARSSATSASRSRTRETSALVPPMSRVMRLRGPERAPESMAPTTPAAGPERAVRTGRARARAGDMRPPFDWLMPIRACGTRTASPASRLAMYSSMTGCSQAFSTVVEQRSNSRNSGWTSDESDTRNPGRAARIAAPMRASWSGFWNAKRRHTAQESASISPIRSTASRIAASARGRITLPPEVIRSATSRRRSRGTRGGGWSR